MHLFFWLAGIAAAILVLAGLATGLTRIFVRWWQEPVGFAVTVFALVLVLLVPQMRDMFVGMTLGYHDGVANEAWWHPLGLGVAATCLGLSAWYWTRAGLFGRLGVSDLTWLAAPIDEPPPPPLALIDWSVAWAPRVALICAAGAAAGPLLLSWETPITAPLDVFGPPAAGAILLAIAGVVFSLWTMPWWVLPLTLSVVLALTAAVASRLTLTPFDRLMSTSLLGFLFLGIVFLLITFRRHFFNGAWMLRFEVPGTSPLWSWRTTAMMIAAPFGWPAALMALGLAPAAVALLAYCPWVWEWVHPPTAALLALSFLVPILALLLAVLRDAVAALLLLLNRIWSWTDCHVLGGYSPTRTRAQVDAVSSTLGVVVLVCLTMVQDYWQDWDSHYVVRAMPAAPAPGAGVDSRPTLGEAVAAWRAARPWTRERNDVPAIIVAVEGGASRSGAWLLPVLRHFDEATDNQFSRHLFAISAVSGGALGAVTYVEALARDGAPTGGIANDPPPPDGWSALWADGRTGHGVVELARGDLLSPAIATFFLNDAVGRTVLAPVWSGWDRAAALEQTFERHWRNQQGFALPAPQTERGFVDLMTQRPGVLPHLLLNGTEVKTGRRIITSSIRFTPEDGLFDGADDFLKQFGRDVPMSTAVLNSARFPLISPGGRFLDGNEDRQVVDGGVFENYGARTAWELARELARAGLRPIVVVVGNDVDAAADDAARHAYLEAHPSLAPPRLLQESVISCAERPVPDAAQRSREAKTRARNAGAGFMPEGLAVVLGLNATRGAHGADELNNLRRTFCGEPRRFFHIDMPMPMAVQRQAAPLNWVLDQRSCRFFLGAALRAPFNQAQTESLRDTLVALGLPAGTRDIQSIPSHAPDCDLTK